MQNGIIFVSEGIISLDLQVTLSKYYKVVNVFKNTAPQEQYNLSGTDFFIIDSDLYSIKELENILLKLNLNPKVKIIVLTSQPEDWKRQSFRFEHVIDKPFTYDLLFEAIEN